MKKYHVAVDVTLTIDINVTADFAAEAERLAEALVAGGTINNVVYDPMNYRGCNAQVVSVEKEEVA